MTYYVFYEKPAQMQSKVTQKDIAEKLNLSQSLIAKVLNGRSDAWVSAENRRRILEAAREMNYTPNTAARALRRGKTQTVGCIFFHSVEPDLVVEAMASSLEKVSYDLIVKVIIRPEEALQKIASLTADGLCDALVLWGSEPDIEPSCQFLSESGIPFIAKARFEDSHPDWIQVDMDHEALMWQAVEHLVRCGHRRIAYLGYDSDMVYARKLTEGFRAAIQTYIGEAVRNDYLWRISLTQASVFDAISYWLDDLGSERPTAIVMGVGYAPWRDVELSLARRGQRVADRDGGLAVCGIGGSEQPLLFGSGFAYPDHSQMKLAELLTQNALIPMLTGKPTPTITKLVLPLQPCQSLEIPIHATEYDSNRGRHR